MEPTKDMIERGVSVAPESWVYDRWPEHSVMLIVATALRPYELGFTLNGVEQGALDTLKRGLDGEDHLSVPAMRVVVDSLERAQRTLVATRSESALWAAEQELADAKDACGDLFGLHGGLIGAIKAMRARIEVLESAPCEWTDVDYERALAATMPGWDLCTNVSAVMRALRPATPSATSGESASETAQWTDQDIVTAQSAAWSHRSGLNGRVVAALRAVEYRLVPAEASAEAEELRQEIEKLAQRYRDADSAEDAVDAPRVVRDLNELLDRVNARNSLAFLEQHDAKWEKQIDELKATVAGSLTCRDQLEQRVTEIETAQREAIDALDLRDPNAVPMSDEWILVEGCKGVAMALADCHTRIAELQAGTSRWTIVRDAEILAFVKDSGAGGLFGLGVWRKALVRFLGRRVGEVTGPEHPTSAVYAGLVKAAPQDVVAQAPGESMSERAVSAIMYELYGRSETVANNPMTAACIRAGLHRALTDDPTGEAVARADELRRLVDKARTERDGMEATLTTIAELLGVVKPAAPMSEQARARYVGDIVAGVRLGRSSEKDTDVLDALEKAHCIEGDYYEDDVHPVVEMVGRLQETIERQQKRIHEQKHEVQQDEEWLAKHGKVLVAALSEKDRADVEFLRACTAPGNSNDSAVYRRIVDIFDVRFPRSKPRRKSATELADELYNQIAPLGLRHSVSAIVDELVRRAEPSDA